MIAPLSGVSPFSIPGLPGTSAAPEAAGQDFGSVLKSLVGGAVDTLKQGEAAAIQGIQGTMPVQQVVDQVMAAERTLQASLAIRDKLVSSFLEISRMQI
jgi:flagellar hook-basal body complex protein FliE